MGSTGADRTSQGCIRSAVYRDSNTAAGSLNYHPQIGDSALNTSRVRSITPRSNPIQRRLAVPGSQRAPW
jgi:hypothetical protein